MSYPKSLGKTATLTALLLAVGVGLGSGTSNIMTSQNVDAQMMGGGNNTGMKMKSGEMMMTGMGGNNVTSSINLMNVISEAIGSNINVSLSDAATTAESSVGNGSHAASAELGENNGFLVYNIMVIDPSMNFSKVLVDPGNGEVLFTKQLSKEEHMMMHEMGGRDMMMGPGMMMGGPGGMMKDDRMGMGSPGGMWR